MAASKDISEWEAMFKCADKDNSGALSKDEVKELLKKGNSKMTETTLDEVFTFFDGPTGDKCIKLDEFIKGLQDLQDFVKYMEQGFKELDADNSGCLDRNELKKLMDESGKKFSESEIDEILKQVDPSGDGKISLDEFINGFT